MRTYWLLDQHDGTGPTALVETDGRMHIVDVIRFGPEITELKDQQKVWDQVIGKVAPAMKPFVDASSLDEEGVALHPKLRTDGRVGTGKGGRGGRGDSDQRGIGVGRASGGPSRKRSRGDR